MKVADDPNVNTNNVANLEGFEDANALVKKGLLDIDKQDYSETTISFNEEADGSYRVEWKVDDAPMIDFIKRTFPFIGAALLVIMGGLSLAYFSGPGPFLLGIALIGWAGYCVFAALKNREEKYTFIIGIDNFTIVHDRVFHSEKLLDYSTIKCIELMATGTEDSWGQTMSITEKIGRNAVVGKKESVELLCKTMDVLFRRVRARRKKLGKGDEMTVVGQ